MRCRLPHASLAPDGSAVNAVDAQVILSTSGMNLILRHLSCLESKADVSGADIY